MLPANSSSTKSLDTAGPRKNSVVAGVVASRRGLRDITNTSSGVGPDLGKKQQRNIPKVKPTKAQHLNGGQVSADACRGADDIDARDSNDPRMATQYVADIYSRFREKEVNGVDPQYTAKLLHINAKMRAILIDWLIEVHQKFRCVPETLYLTINLIDRYLEIKQSVERSKLQLVGVTSFLIAAKYEEIWPPEIRDLVHVTDKAYTSNDILIMETSILNELDFKITVPSTHNFLVRFLKAAHADRRMVWLACYITERTILEVRMLNFLPSVVAAASVWLARKNLQRNPWSPTMLKYTSYAEKDLEPCLAAMTEILATTTSLIAVKRKYGSQKFGAVSSIAIQGLKTTA